jgi:hypothetical protein
MQWNSSSWKAADRNTNIREVHKYSSTHAPRTEHSAPSTSTQHQAPSTEHVARGTIDRHLSGLTQ